MQARVLVVVAFLIIGCATETAIEAAPAPLLGSADGSDAADRACAVVLRSVGRAREVDGRPATLCRDGLCWIALEATIDVADVAITDGGTPEVLFRDPDGPLGWIAASEPTPVEGAAGGFARFVVRLAEGGIRDGLSSGALSRAQLELVAYLRAPSGSRIFDHNERPGDLDNLTVSGADAFAFDADVAVCPGESARPVDAVATFDAAWNVSLEGSVRAGGALAVDYAPERLSQCFGDTYMSNATWDTLAWLRVLPSGEVLPYQSVIACDDLRCSDPRGERVVFELPEGTEAVELWFSTSGRSCGVHYDSNFGRNYRFEVTRPVGWVGGFVSKISRAGGAPCEGYDASNIGGSVGYGTWARQRAISSHICFRVWSEGVTDLGHAEPAAVSARLVCTWDGETEPRRHGVTFDGQVGNDARYRSSLAGLDPFRPYRCPEMPTRREGSYEVAGATCVAEVNGADFGPTGPGSSFRLTYSDYPDNAWRAANCAP